MHTARAILALFGREIALDVISYINEHGVEAIHAEVGQARANSYAPPLFSWATIQGKDLSDEERASVIVATAYVFDFLAPKYAHLPPRLIASAVIQTPGFFGKLGYADERLLGEGALNVYAKGFTPANQYLRALTTPPEASALSGSAISPAYAHLLRRAAEADGSRHASRLADADSEAAANEGYLNIAVVAFEIGLYIQEMSLHLEVSYRAARRRYLMNLSRISLLDLSRSWDEVGDLPVLKRTLTLLTIGRPTVLIDGPEIGSLFRRIGNAISSTARRAANFVGNVYAGVTNAIGRAVATPIGQAAVGVIGAAVSVVAPPAGAAIVLGGRLIGQHYNNLDARRRGNPNQDITLAELGAAAAGNPDMRIINAAAAANITSATPSRLVHIMNMHDAGQVAAALGVTPTRAARIQAALMRSGLKQLDAPVNPNSPALKRTISLTQAP